MTADARTLEDVVRVLAHAVSDLQDRVRDLELSQGSKSATVRRSSGEAVARRCRDVTTKFKTTATEEHDDAA